MGIPVPSWKFLVPVTLFLLFARFSSWDSSLNSLRLFVFPPEEVSRFHLSPEIHSLRSATTRIYNFTLAEEILSPNGVQKTVFTINGWFKPLSSALSWSFTGLFPGPLIEVRSGDLLVVNVVNHLSEGTSLHWHGIKHSLGMFLNQNFHPYLTSNFRKKLTRRCFRRHAVSNTAWRKSHLPYTNFTRAIRDLLASRVSRDLLGTRPHDLTGTIHTILLKEPMVFLGRLSYTRLWNAREYHVLIRMSWEPSNHWDTREALNLPVSWIRSCLLATGTTAQAEKFRIGFKVFALTGMVHFYSVFSSISEQVWHRTGTRRCS